MIGSCPHHSADWRLCPECREERLTGRPVPSLAEAMAVLADRTAPAATSTDGGADAAEPAEVDYADVLRAGLRKLLDRIGWAGLSKEDLSHLLRSAIYGAPPHTDVVMRVVEALAEPSLLHVIGTNAVPSAEPASDHGEQTTTLTDASAAGPPAD